MHGAVYQNTLVIMECRLAAVNAPAEKQFSGCFAFGTSWNLAYLSDIKF